MSLLGIGLAAAGVLVPGAGIAIGVVKLGARVFFGKARDAAAKVPPKVWIALAVVAALVGGYFLHQHKASAALAAAYAHGKSDADAAWGKRLAEEQTTALIWKTRAEAKAAAISKDIGERHDQDLRDIASRADDQRLRGPGAAAAPACVRPQGNAPIPAAAGGHDPTGGRADPGVAGLPPESGLAIVPWSGLVNAAQGADADRSEVIAWREWYAREKAARDAAVAAAVPKAK